MPHKRRAPNLEESNLEMLVHRNNLESVFCGGSFCLQDTIVRGVLESADEEMNLVMKNLTLTPLQGEKKELEWIYIKGHHIR